VCAPRDYRRRNTQGAILVSPHATGAHFSMYLLNMGALAAPCCRAALACWRLSSRRARGRAELHVRGAAARRRAVRRRRVCLLCTCGGAQLTLPRLCSFVFVLDGGVQVLAGEAQHALLADDFAYFPPEAAHACVRSRCPPPPPPTGVH
jgi:hypothetical protein